MKYLPLAAIFCLLFIVTGVHADDNTSQAKDKYCYAIVQGNKAAFVFPIMDNEHWTWFSKETKDNELEYSWEVSLHGEQHSFNFGVYLFKYTGQDQKNGTLPQLLTEAQWSVFDQQVTPDGGSTSKMFENMKINSKVIDGGIVVSISDKETFNQIFAINPKIAHFSIRTPFDVPFTCDAPIEYRGQNDQQSAARKQKDAP